MCGWTGVGREREGGQRSDGGALLKLAGRCLGVVLVMGGWLREGSCGNDDPSLLGFLVSQIVARAVWARIDGVCGDLGAIVC